MSPRSGKCPVTCLHLAEPQPAVVAVEAGPAEVPAAVLAHHREAGAAARVLPGGVGDAHRVLAVVAEGVVEHLHPAAVGGLATLRLTGAGDGGEVLLVPDGEELEALRRAGGDLLAVEAPALRGVPESGLK